ncbi:MAG: ATP-binding protein, partial [Thermoplasmata archaeon]|nr:ATP-binding protein [Thermoplasmata archaeon]
MQQQKNDFVGLIYGDVGSTKFNFTVDAHNLRKFDYVAAPHEEGYVLAQVMDIKGYSDLKFEDAITIKSNGSVPPIKSDVSAYAEVIGFRDKEGRLQAPRSPFEAGAQITLAHEDLIRHVLGLQAEKQNGAYLGLLKGHDLP